MAIKKQFEYEAAPDASPDEIGQYLLELPPGKYRVAILDEKPVRSIPQNKYYWGVVVKMIAEDTGNEPAYLHEELKKEFNPRAVIIKGDVKLIGGPTSELKRKAFAQYMDAIKVWAMEFLGIRIPEPNELTDEQLLELANY